MQFGDGRVRSVQGIHALLEGCFTDICIQDLSATQYLSPVQLWRWLEDMYDLHLLIEDDVSLLRDEYLSALEPMVGADGAIRHQTSLRLFVAKTA